MLGVCMMGKHYQVDSNYNDEMPCLQELLKQIIESAIKEREPIWPQK
jgi:hypothetical protein